MELRVLKENIFSNYIIFQDKNNDILYTSKRNNIFGTEVESKYDNLICISKIKNVGINIVFNVKNKDNNDEIKNIELKIKPKIKLCYEFVFESTLFQWSTESILPHHFTFSIINNNTKIQICDFKNDLFTSLSKLGLIKFIPSTVIPEFSSILRLILLSTLIQYRRIISGL